MPSTKPLQTASLSGIDSIDDDKIQAPQVDSIALEETTYKTPTKNNSVSPLKAYTASPPDENANWSSIQQSDSDISPYNSPVQDHVPHDERDELEHQQIHTEPSPLPTQNQENVAAAPGTIETSSHEPAPRSDDISDSEINSPQAPVQTSTIVRSSLNFASLPARDPTHNRKSNNGARVSRSSHLLITAPSRNDKSIGGRASDMSFVAGQEDNIESIESNAVPLEAVEDTKVPNTSTFTSEANLPTTKSKVQRLNERISQLSQLAPIRPSRSVPDLEVASSFIDDNLVEVLNNVVDEQRQNHNSKLDEENKVEDEDEDGDWIPQRPQASENRLALSETVPQDNGFTSESSIGIPKIMKNTAILVTDEKVSDMHPLNLSPSKLPKAVKFHTDSDYEDNFHRGTPKHTGQTSRHKAASSYKSPFDSALSAVKNHQANLFTKAKQMLFSKSKNDITIEQAANTTVSLSNSPSKQVEKSIPCSQIQINGGDGITEQHGAVGVSQNGRVNIPIGIELPSTSSGSPRKKTALPVSQVSTSTTEQGSKFDHSREIHFMSINQKQPIITHGANLTAHKVDSVPNIAKDDNQVEERRMSTKSLSEDEVVAQNVGILKTFSDILVSDLVEDKVKLNTQENTVDWHHEISEDDLSGSDLDSDRQQPSKLPKPTPNSAHRFQQPVARPSILQKSTSNKNIMRSNSGKAQEGSRNAKNPSTSIKLTTASQREMDQRKVQHLSEQYH